MNKRVEACGGHVSPGSTKHWKTVRGPERQEKGKEQNWELAHQLQLERRYNDENVERACLPGHLRAPYREKMQEGIRNRVLS